MALFASLPMYDWPEIQEKTDRLWFELAMQLAVNGFDSGDLPENLDRNCDMHESWLRSDLLISQTCGLPYVRDLKNKVVILGTPVYSLHAGYGCKPGEYCSVIVTKQDRSDVTPAVFEKGRLAVNDLRSQSGYASFFGYLLDHGIGQFGGQLIMSGAHRNSIRMVASGEADIAAIDAVTWGLAKRYEPAAAEVRIVATTKPMPSLPLITSLGHASKLKSIKTALSKAIRRLPRTDRDVLKLERLADATDANYDVVESRWHQLVDAGLVESS